MLSPTGFLETIFGLFSTYCLISDWFMTWIITAIELMDKYDGDRGGFRHLTQESGGHRPREPRC